MIRQKKQGRSEDLASSRIPPRNSPRASVRGFLFRGMFLGKNRIAGAIALGLFVLWISIGGGLTIDGAHRGVAAILRFLIHLPGPLAWMLSALGLGVAAVKIFALERVGWVFSLALGCAAMLFIDAAAGALGFFGIRFFGVASGQIPAALLLLPGIFSLWKNFNPNWSVSLRIGDEGNFEGEKSTNGAWIAWTIAPALATLLLAAVSTPGWLWSSEFGGYDALSYHLQLPREWLALGRVQTLSHNIYSSFPSFVECAYLHVMAMRGSASAGALDAQILHGLFAVVTATMIAQLAMTCYEKCCDKPHDPALAKRTQTIVGWSAAALFLGLPWIIVTGSLAYNEMPMVLMLTAALWLIFSRRLDSSQRGIFTALAILCAAAMGSKLTAALFVTAPVALLAIAWLARLIRDGRATVPLAIRVCTIAVIAGIIVLSPWWLRGAIANGSPFFPILGNGGLTAIQAEIFHRAHGPIASSEWWSALHDQFLFAGLTATAPNAEPWRPFWSILPWMGASAGIVLLCKRESRFICAQLIFVACVQLILWLFLTHAKGRFLIPTAIPLVVLVALVVANLERARWLGRAALCSILAAWCMQPLLAYATDGPLIENRFTPATGIGLEPIFTGESGGDGLPAALYRLPTTARIVSLGGSAVFWWPMIPGYSTVWNENPVGRALALSGGDPEIAIAELRRAGWTHVVIDENMLRIWRKSDWLDSSITQSAVAAFLARLKPLCETGGGSLYSLDRSQEGGVR